VEVADALGGELERGKIWAGKTAGGDGQLAGLNLERLTSSRRPALEPRAVIAERVVPFGRDARANLDDSGTLGRELGEVEPPPGEWRSRP
jgi:hypothetical protein